jgi:hypothetical protein
MMCAAMDVAGSRFTQKGTHRLCMRQISLQSRRNSVSICPFLLDGKTTWLVYGFAYSDYQGAPVVRTYPGDYKRAMIRRRDSSDLQRHLLLHIAGASLRGNCDERSPLRCYGFEDPETETGRDVTQILFVRRGDRAQHSC